MDTDFFFGPAEHGGAAAHQFIYIDGVNFVFAAPGKTQQLLGFLNAVRLTCQKLNHDTCSNCRTDNTCYVWPHCMHQQEVVGVGF